MTENKSQLEIANEKIEFLNNRITELKADGIVEALENGRLRKSVLRLINVGKEAAVVLGDIAKEFKVDLNSSPSFMNLMVTIQEEEAKQ